MFKKLFIVFFVIISIGTAQAETRAEFVLEISAPTVSREVPSASGLSTLGDFFYAIGDDSSWLFKLDQKFAVTDKQLIKQYPIEADGRIQKKVKPDFEAMAQFSLNNQIWHVVLGSGSKAGVRETGYLLSSDRTTKYESSLKSLYAQLKSASGFSELNIEGLVLTGSKAYIFNRVNAGGNMIFAVNQGELIDYMLGKLERLSKVKAYRVKLPKVENFEAGLSGGDYWAKKSSLVFTASVEATGSSYADGAILGSFVGVIPIEKLKEEETLDLTTTTIPLLSNGRVLITKAESLAITANDENKIEGAIASDNDNGTSDFIRFKLVKKN